MIDSFPKRPRQYAAEIVLMKTRKERRDALAKVPEDCRDTTKLHVQIYFDRKKIAKK